MIGLDVEFKVNECFVFVLMISVVDILLDFDIVLFVKVDLFGGELGFMCVIVDCCRWLNNVFIVFYISW